MNPAQWVADLLTSVSSPLHLYWTSGDIPLLVGGLIGLYVGIRLARMLMRAIDHHYDY